MKSKRHRSPRCDTLKCVWYVTDGHTLRMPLRVSNDEAAALVASGKGWAYCPKHAYKRVMRERA